MSAFPAALMQAASEFVARAAEHGTTVATAESCTGGLVAALLTEIAGSSAVVDCGFVTYSNGAKIAALGVPAQSIETHGAVSKEVACAMAQGALDKSRADLSVAITGIAGPGGGLEAKPVGLVHFACATRNGRRVHVEKRFGSIGRGAVRMNSVEVALTLLLQAIENDQVPDDAP